MNDWALQTVSLLFRDKFHIGGVVDFVADRGKRFPVLELLTEGGDENEI